MQLFTIENEADRIVFKGDLPNLDYTVYTIYKAARESIRLSRDNGLKVTTSSGDVFLFKFQMFDTQYGFATDEDLRVYLEGLV